MLLRVDRPRPAVVLLRTAVVRLVLEEHAQVVVGVAILRVDCDRPAEVLLRTVVVLLVLDEEPARGHFASATEPRHARSPYNLGVLLENHKEDYDGAEQHYRRAIAIDPEYADAHCNLDVLLEQRKADCHSVAGQPRRSSWCL